MRTTEMTKAEATRRYVAACKKAGMTIGEMNAETFSHLTNDGEALADGHYPSNMLSMVCRVHCAEEVANAPRAIPGARRTPAFYGE